MLILTSVSVAYNRLIPDQASPVQHVSFAKTPVLLQIFALLWLLIDVLQGIPVPCTLYSVPCTVV